MFDARRVAIHESGHAAIISIYGEPFGAGCARVWATANGGCAEYFGAERLSDELYGAVQFAGLSAERRAFGCVPVEHGRADLQSINKLLDGRGDANRLWNRYRRLAHRLVDENWLSIERLAEALLAVGELTGDDIYRVLNGGGHYCILHPC